MDFNEFIQGIWARHRTDAEGAAGELEARVGEVDDAEKALKFINTSNHAIGEHLGDWHRAKALAEKAMAHADDSRDYSKPYGNLAVAQFMAGDHVGALVSEGQSILLTKTERLSALVRTRVLLAGAMIGSGKLGEGAEIYAGALELARSEKGKLACDQPVAVTSNNLAGEFLEKQDRTDAETALMLKAAEAAREFWLKCGTWENEERAEYLLALVHNARNEPDTALEHAARAIEVIQKNGEEEVDEAFVNLAMAKSFSLKQDREHYETAMARADELAGQFPDQGLKDWYKEERTKVEWEQQ